MEKHQIADGIVLYMFEPRPDRHYGYNITALIENGQAMLIDTAFEEHAQTKRCGIVTPRSFIRNGITMCTAARRRVACQGLHFPHLD
ncbi:hypothetical protein ABU162_19910 [Paenibacillus thiaminolyticus]|uniref:hypothetical protein n=1 Tax=Paenibacillus thiaminolyticus TaxID=49283 RepID=UPI0035A5E89A